jgi:hypothetical protein
MIHLSLPARLDPHGCLALAQTSFPLSKSEFRLSVRDALLLFLTQGHGDGLSVDTRQSDMRKSNGFSFGPEGIHSFSAATGQRLDGLIPAA